jgi:hypothetical protein
MKKVLFVMTHPGSNWERLAQALNELPCVEAFCTGWQYRHPDDLEALTRQPHKRKNSTAIWADVLLHNQDFACQALFGTCDFIFWHQPFDPDHKDWVSYGKYAKIYYDHRTEGMRQYSLRCATVRWNPPFQDLINLS